MELRAVRYFVAIAESGSVTGAAATVRVAQPSLSRQLRGLERELGAELFERGAGRLRLSAAGSALLPLARDLLARADGLSSTAQTLAAGRLRTLRIAAPPTTVSDVVAPFVATFDQGDPLPSVTAIPTADVYTGLRDGSVDLALSARAPEPDLGQRLVAHFPIWLYVAPDDRRARRRVRIGIADLDAERLLVLPTGFVQRELFEAAAARAQLPLDGAREVSSPDVAQALCAAGWGDAVVSDDSRFGLRGLRIATPDGDLTMPVYAAWTQRHVAAAHVVEVVERLTAFCAARYDQA
ncbi:MAG: LysR family transcriptional regulator [Actinobacteria bacterium]|nr:LysR family transcriptional regulator [Actinomycetota bacterium]